MDRRTFLYLLGGSALVAAFDRAALAQTLSGDEKKEGFVSLFNGKDFDGWRFSGGANAGNWKVEDAVIKLLGGGSPHLATAWDYEDFDVRFEWRAMRATYDSGFFIRSGRSVGANQIQMARGSEGAFFGQVQGAKSAAALHKPPMEWNEWRVVAVGDKVSLWCNGQQAWEATGLKPARGYIGVQAEGAPFEFRNFRIKEIGCTSLMDLKLWNAGPQHQWRIEDDVLVSESKGPDLETKRQDYKDYVLRLEWKIQKGGDSGIYLRGGKFNKAQVQVWDNPVGSSGIYGYGNNPAKNTDSPIGEWNRVEIRLIGNKVTVWHNGEIVVSEFDLKSDPNFPDAGGITFQAHPPAQQMWWRNIRIKEIK